VLSPKDMSAQAVIANSIGAVVISPDHSLYWQFVSHESRVGSEDHSPPGSMPPMVEKRWAGRSAVMSSTPKRSTADCAN
jgi:hypothetical protein